MAVATPTFTGFRPEAIQFLVDLAANNERAWFQPRKAEYERLLKEPLEALIVALGDRFERAASRCAPTRRSRRSGSTATSASRRTSRRTRPTSGRASRGPGRRRRGDAAARTPEVHSSGGYFHLSAGRDLRRRRDLASGQAVDRRVPAPRGRRPEAFHASSRNPASSTRSAGGDDGHSLKRVPAGYAADHPEAETLKMKDVVFGRRLSDDEAMSPHLPDVMADTFEAAMPMFQYLATIG